MRGDDSVTDVVFRVAGRLAVLAGFALLTLFVLGILLKPALPDGIPPGRDGRVLLLILGCVALLLAHVAVTLIFERGHWTTAGLGAKSVAPLSLVGGLLVGVAASGTVLAIRVGMGLAEFEPQLPLGAGQLTDELTVVAAATLVEALVFRGYFQGLIELQGGRVASVVVPAIAATLYQLANQQPTWPVIAAAAATALLLGGVRLRSKSLVAAWLCHVGILVPAILTGRL